MDLTPGITSAIAIKPQHIFDIYGLQLITEPTRVTMNSCKLIDHCITNSPDKIAKSGSVHLAIDHFRYIKIQSKTKGIISRLWGVNSYKSLYLFPRAWR